MDFIRLLSFNSLHKSDYFGIKSYVNDFMKFYNLMQIANFVELDFRYLDFKKYKYIAKEYGNDFLKYIIFSNYQPNLGKLFFKDNLNYSFYKKNNLNYLNYWLCMKPSKRLVVMPWSSFFFNEIWLKNVNVFSHVKHDAKLYKYTPVNVKMPLLSYIDKYGSLFGRVDDLFEFSINPFIFNLKLNKFVVRNLNFLRISYQMEMMIYYLKR